MIAADRFRPCSLGINELPLRGLLIDTDRTRTGCLAIAIKPMSDANVELLN